MALCVADQAPFLVVHLRGRLDGVDAPRRRARAGDQHARSLTCLYREHPIDPALSAGAERFRNAAHDRALRLRVPFWTDAFRLGPHGEHADIFEPAGRGGGEGPHMKGIAPLFLGIFATFAFSWVGLALIPNYQIGHLDPQSDEEGTDIYPVPKSGMAERGRQIYAANGCVYCHSQQVRADYAASDIERKWGVRRSAPRDYIFERPVLIGKTRMGPDLSNIGKRAPSDDQNAPPPASTGPGASPTPAASPAANAPASPATSPAASPAAS